MTQDAGAVLRAGGLAPPDSDPGEPADPVTARTYRHRALGARPVVRLVARPLGPAEDVALGLQGFALAAESAPLALTRRRTLGFPGWVLIHHPEDADLALKTLEGMEPLARLARSRSGAARDGFDAIAGRLARVVPHFLPSYFEQAGRAFIEAGAPAPAAVMFGRAREAERTYALAVDEERRLAAFIEFALAGALTGRSLADYAAQLLAAGDPEAAYATFRRLCVERARAGVAPWAEMATQLRRLGNAAGIDLEADERALVTELLQTPSLASAPLGFWRAYRRPLLAVARRSPAARGALLNLHPGTAGIDEWWLGLLDPAGALEAVTGPAGGVTPAAAPRGGAAAWLSRTVAASSRDWPSPGAPDALFALVRRMARRLRADAAPVQLAGRHAWRLDLDLLDLALELGLPVAPPAPAPSFPLERWLERPAARRRDLDHVAADPAWGQVLLQALDAYFVRSPPVSLLGGGRLRRGFSAWLDLVAGRIEHGGLADLGEDLGRLKRAVEPGALDVNPAARDRILGAEAALSLARTLRAGCLDEFGWPALEAARARLGGSLTVSGAWPNLVLSDGLRAIVVGPDAILLEHDLRTGTGPARRQAAFLYTGGQLLVRWWAPGAGWRAYWSGRPAEMFDARALAWTSWAAPLGLSLELDDGSRTTGSRSIRPGDTTAAEPRHLACDGTEFWALVDGAFRQFDPRSGRTGAPSLPEFLAAFDAGGRLVAESSWILPLPPGVEAGPLGSRDGLVGVRVRRGADGSFEAEATDGRRVAARLPSAPVALVSFPGDPSGRPRPVTIQWQQLTLWDPAGRFRLLQATALQPSRVHAAATPVVPPPAYWIALRPRDEAGSASLRAISDEVARGLVAAPDRADAVRQLLPAISHPDLRRSVADQAGIAATLQETIDDLVARVREQEAASAGPSDTALQDALGGLIAGVPSFGTAERGSSAVRQLAMVDRFMAAGTTPKQFIGSPVPWALLAGRMAAAAYRAASPAVGAAERGALLGFLEEWSATVFAKHPEWFRVVMALEGPDSELSATTWLRYRGGRRWFISRRLGGYGQPARRLILERAHWGSFEPPPDMTVEWQRVGAGSWESGKRIRRLCRLVESRGPAPWVPERVDALVRWTGVTRAEAALLLAGLPLGDGLHFLPGEVRRMLGVKVAEAAAARDRLLGLPVQRRIELIAAAMPDNPADLWKRFRADDLEGTPARIARAWLEAFGRQEAADDATAGALRSSLRLARPAAEALRSFTDPAGDGRLNTDAVWVAGSGGRLHALPGAARQPFDGPVLHDLSQLIPWLFAARPVGDRARSGAPEALRRARERLANPDLLVATGRTAGDLEGRPLLDLVPGPPYRPARGPEVPGSRDTGAFVLVAGAGSGFAHVWIRPARVDAEADAGLLRLLSEPTRIAYRRVQFLLGAGAGELVERVAATPVPSGAWEANPTASAPALVEEVARVTALSPEAAALYLQLMAAPDPTVRGLRTWNGWTGPVYERAAGELAASGLAVRARRARAGRDVFLPGPWEELKAPDLPVEAWKLRLYGGRPLGRLLVPRPLHHLFADAWRMVQAGDGPAFHAG